MRVAATFACEFACTFANAFAGALAMAAAAAAAAATPIWTAQASDQVHAAVRNERDGGVCLDYDFGHVSGYAVARRELPMVWPDHAVVDLRVKARGGPNTLQLKWVDASGDNVWWFNQPDAAIGTQWQSLRIPQRRIEFAWGPAPDHQLRETRFMELVVVAGKAGGKGRICADGMRWSSEAAPPAVLPTPAWDPTRHAWDAGLLRDFSGALLHWPARNRPRDYRVQGSADGLHWQTLRSVTGAEGSLDALHLPEARARWLRLTGATQPTSLQLIDAAGPQAWRSGDDALKARAALEPRGAWPRAYRGEQNYWTLLGVDGLGQHSALVSEDGAVELGVGGPSLEPLVELVWQDGRTERISWAQVQSRASLVQGDLPLPRVHWQHPDFALDIETSATGDAAERVAGKPRQEPSALVRYRFTPLATPHAATLKAARLLLLLRPLQVNPPQQFLTTPGGQATVRRLRMGPQGLDVDGRWRVATLPAATTVGAATGDASALQDPAQSPPPPAAPSAARVLWRHGQVQGHGSLTDPNGHASAVLAFDLPLDGAGEAGAPQVSVRWGLLPGETGHAGRGIPFTPLRNVAQADALQAQAVAQWQQRLGRLRLDLPGADPRLTQTLRISLAHMLLSRSGVALRPGTRAYARSWIRDGAMMVSALTRMGESVVAREFVDWFGERLFANGKVPCCVDPRGSDPVAENDSHGQYIFAVAELWRRRQPGDGVDATWLARHWPRVQAATHYMESLRQSERLAARQGSAGVDAAFFGMMPASISHEGYAAKPMHSYWDNFWALRGYKDAVFLAQALQAPAQAHTFGLWRDAFEADLTVSLQRAMDFHQIAYLPGAAELGDFDATSTTVALDPAQAQDVLPPGSLQATLARYTADAQRRTAGEKPWVDYTPYELRTVGTLLRLGQQEQALALLDFFFADQRPAGWLQWAEVVMRDPRQVHFLGDMPHAWVSSDYVRSALDALVYEREQASRLHPDAPATLVIGAGWTPAWWALGRLQAEGLVTRWGRMGLQLSPTPGGWQLRLQGLAAGTPARLVWPQGLALPRAFSGSNGDAAPGVALPWDGRELLLPPADDQGSILVQIHPLS